MTGKTIIEVKATLPYALRNPGCAKDEMQMRRLAAARIEKLEDELTALRAQVETLRTALAAYVADENRFNRGEGEPYGSISTEIGMIARSALKETGQ